MWLVFELPSSPTFLVWAAQHMLRTPIKAVCATCCGMPNALPILGQLWQHTGSPSSSCLGAAWRVALHSWGRVSTGSAWLVSTCEQPRERRRAQSAVTTTATERMQWPCCCTTTAIQQKYLRDELLLPKLGTPTLVQFVCRMMPQDLPSCLLHFHIVGLGLLQAHL
jgi:hypothetical protein